METAAAAVIDYSVQFVAVNLSYELFFHYRLRKNYIVTRLSDWKTHPNLTHFCKSEFLSLLLAVLCDTNGY